MKKIYCDVRRKYFYDDEPCWYQQHKIPEPKKVCVKCDYYKSLRVKRISKKDPLEKAINQFSKASHTPKGNIKFYVHIYKKINKARQDSKRSIEFLKRTTRDYLQSLEEASTDGWLQENEVSYLKQTWQKFINKEENQGKFRMWILENYKGKRVNPALEVLSRALLKDAEEFGRGKPHYKEVSKLLSSIVKENKGHPYTVATLKDKYPILKIPGLKFDHPPRLPASKVELICDTLIETKNYFEAKGESFLPKPLPTEGYVRTVLQILDAAHEMMKIPKHKGIPISIPKKSV